MGLGVAIAAGTTALNIMAARQKTKAQKALAEYNQRVAQDQNMPDLRTRCSLYVQLFLIANAGDDVWDEAHYNTLGCAEFDPWSLDVSR